MVEITIDGRVCPVEEGRTIMDAAYANDVYIPAVCHHPSLPPFENLSLSGRVYRGHAAIENEPAGADVVTALEGCGLCVVGVNGGDPVRACCTTVTAGMVVTTEGEDLRQLRCERLSDILARHPHACITCAQREGCSLEDCSSNTAREERCCSQFHNCELRKVSEYVGVAENTPRFRHPGLAVPGGEPLFNRDFNLCIDCVRCVRACNQVRGVEALGLVHSGGRLVVGSVAPTLAESECRFCGACVEVCPTGALSDKNGAGDRESRLVPCTNTCAAGADVPGYIRAVADGDYGRAAALIRQALPLPGVLGHICFHECETQCRRGRIDDPIAICAIKRFAVDRGDQFARASMPAPAENGRKVAIVGGGPAGLSASYFLRFKGYNVGVFDAAERAGGVPATAIPGHRLPADVMERDVDFIRQLGVEIETGRAFENGGEMSALLDEEFDALLVAVGLPDSRTLDVAGKDLRGVHWGLDFLQSSNGGSGAGAGQPVETGNNIVVVGGGNVAVDVAMTALRMTGGKGSVRLFCLEGRDEMPAHDYEIGKAEAEGIEINPAWGPAAISGRNGAVESVTFRRCTSVFDDNGGFAPQYDDTVTETAAATSVILAVGQAPSGAVPGAGDGVFFAGDAAGKGPFSVVDAVASGRKAAEDIDRYLGGDGHVTIEVDPGDPPPQWIGRVEGFASQARAAVPTEDPLKRRIDFREIEGAYAEDDARSEAARCLQCDLRLVIGAVQLPPERWLAFEREMVARAPAAAGVLVLADGEKKATLIKGTEDIRGALEEKLADGAAAEWFKWEEDGMYTKRESELIQSHLNRYGEMPGGGDDELDDLF